MEAGPCLVRLLCSASIEVNVLARGERGVPEGPMLRAIGVGDCSLFLNLPVLSLAEVLVLGNAQGHGRQRVLDLDLVLTLLVH